MKYLLTPILLFSLLLPAAHLAQAHTLENDGPIQGVMHINPSHKPTVGEPAHFEFFLKNRSTKFDPTAYTYELVITGEDMATATVPVVADGSVVRGEYTFLQEGEDYTASLTGSSTVASQPSFEFEFDDIFVFPVGQHESAIDNLLEQHAAHIVLVILVLLAFAGIVGYDHFVVRRRRA